MWISDGAGGFTTGELIDVECAPYGIAVADFDGDGHLDLATSIYGEDEIAIRAGTGAGEFDPPQVVASDIESFAPRAADLDQDGHMDLALVEDAAVYTLINQLPDLTFIRGDVDGSGFFNGLVDGFYLMNWAFVPGFAAPACLDADDADDDERSTD